MGTDFDDFTEKAFHLSKKVPIKARRNRSLLLSIMTLSGFDFLSKRVVALSIISPTRVSNYKKIKLELKFYYFSNLRKIMLKHIFNTHF